MFSSRINPADSTYFVAPPTNNAPRHQTHIYVEHTNGVFVPSAVHEQLHSQLETQRNLKNAESGAQQATSYWNFTDDAKDYAEFVSDAMLFFKKLGDHISGFACGFCIFLIVACYSDYSSQFFFSLYSKFFTVVEKWFMAMSLTLVVLNLYPMAFELSSIDRRRLAKAMKGEADASAGGGGAAGEGNQQQQAHGGPAGGPSAPSRWQAFEATRLFAARAVNLLTDNVMLRMLLGQSTSPFRHLLQVKFLCYCGCLGATIVEMSISQEQTKASIQTLEAQSSARLQGAILSRCVLFTAAWFLGLRA